MVSLGIGFVLVAALGLALHDGLRLSAHSPVVTAGAPAVEPDGPFSPIALSQHLDSRKVALGERLFHDARLSIDGTVACANCHALNKGGADAQALPRGVRGQMGSINTPTVFNSALNFRQFWDGRADSLEAQVDGPLHNPLEMASTWAQAITAIQADNAYRNEFAALYPEGIEPASVRDAIATFERSLFTPNARFDQFLRGNPGALNEAELAGYRLFKQIGCTSCHQGVAIGGNMYQKLGIMEDYFGKRANPDPGRFKLTQREEDRYFFKVPSLRNVAVTAPYLHDASAATLEEAVSIMARYQLGKTLDGTEISNIVAFLRTLTGEYQGKLLQ